MPDAASHAATESRSGIDGDEHSGRLKTVMAGRYPYTPKSEFVYRYIALSMAHAIDTLMARTRTRPWPPSDRLSNVGRQTMA